MLDEPIRRRAPSEDLRVRQAAIATVEPFNRKISAWQFEVAMLKARMTSTHLQACEREASRVNAEGLTRTIVENLDEFRAAVGELPSDVRHNTRIEDTLRAMQQALQGLETALARQSASATDGDHRAMAR